MFFEDVCLLPTVVSIQFIMSCYKKSNSLYISDVLGIWVLIWIFNPAMEENPKNQTVSAC